MVALPLYVYIPQFYASKSGLSLSVIGAALLVMRLLDAGFDPLIGLVLDRIQTRHRYRKAILLATLPLAFGFIALFRPPALDNTQVSPWFAAASMTVYAGFSLATISYQSWGAALTQALSQRQTPQRSTRRLRPDRRDSGGDPAAAVWHGCPVLAVYRQPVSESAAIAGVVAAATATHRENTGSESAQLVVAAAKPSLSLVVSTLVLLNDGMAICYTQDLQFPHHRSAKMTGNGNRPSHFSF